MTDLNGTPIFDPSIKRRSELIEQMINATAHMPRNRVVATLASWFSLEDLERIAPTFCGPVEEWPTQQEAQIALAVRFRTAMEKRHLIAPLPVFKESAPVLDFSVERRATLMIEALWEAQ